MIAEKFDERAVGLAGAATTVARGRASSGSQRGTSVDCGPRTAPAIQASLTPLPPELEYRFVYRDLVLLDDGANLIVDILENAVAAVARRA